MRWLLLWLACVIQIPGISPCSVALSSWVQNFRESLLQFFLRAVRLVKGLFRHLYP
jgi:hypothetical protein